MKTILLGALGFAACAFGAGPLDKADIVGVADHANPLSYKVGEPIIFTLNLRNAEPFPENTYVLEWMCEGDDGSKKGGKEALPLKKPFTYTTSLSKPGFVRLFAVVRDKNGKEYRKSFTGDASTPEGKQALNRFERNDKRVFFDGGAGVEPEKLQSVPEPADFDAFWAKRKARLAAVPMVATLKEHKSVNAGVRIYSFSVMCAGPRPVTGHLSVPTKSGKYPAQISFHGYGSHFVEQIPANGPTDRLCMFINAHGYELEREDDYYTEFYNSIKSNGKTFGLDKFQNENADTAYFGGMTYRIMRALQYLKSRPEWNKKDLIATGGSMGGLQTMWAAGLDSDVTEARPVIPWCCDMGGRETLKRMKPGWGVAETKVMRYFDPVNMAKRVSPKCYVYITRAGLGDYCCPPSGVAVLWNNLKCKKRIDWVQGSTHGYVPPMPNQCYTDEK